MDNTNPLDNDIEEPSHIHLSRPGRSSGDTTPATGVDEGSGSFWASDGTENAVGADGDGEAP